MDTKLSNIIARAITHAKEVNNFADCDVIQEAVTQLENATNMQEATEAFEYLQVSVEYRKRTDKVTRELFFEFRARMLVVEFETIAKTCPKAYLSANGSLLLVENANGIAIVVNKDRQYGFQLHAEIKPNTRTGSSVGLTGDNYSGVTLEEAIGIIENYKGSLPNFYSNEERKTIEFQTAEQHLARLQGMLGYEKIA